MKYLIPILLLLVATGLNGQIGVSYKYQNNSYSEWDEFISDQTNQVFDVFSNSQEIGVNYWFRLKERRVEFLPELFYRQSGSETFPEGVNANNADISAYGLNVNIQIYPFDFFNDCNCPTFSKQGTFVSKGFYWMINPGVAVTDKSVSYNATDGTSDVEIVASGTQTVFHAGVGAGLDIGIMDLVTLSPFISYRIDFGHDWDTLNDAFDIQELPDRQDLSTHASRLNLGIRLMFRPDYKGNNF